MIARSEKSNFFVAHYDWLAAAAGIAALAAAIALYATGGEEEGSATKAVTQPSVENCGVKPVDLSTFMAATNAVKPLAVPDAKEESFLASERRIFCSNVTNCNRAISAAYLKGEDKKCPFCGTPLEGGAKQVADADGDGLPDKWQRKYGIAVGEVDLDKDGDGFTNREEFEAKTDPTDPKDHPPYVASLSLQLPFREKFVPFAFRGATQVPGGWRCQFFDPKKRDDYGRMGATLTAKVGEEVAGTGYVVKGYEKKEQKQSIKGGQGMTKTVDVSEATVERTSDKKVVTLVRTDSKQPKLASIDVEATLVYARGVTKTFTVVVGSEISLNGEKQRVVAIDAKKSSVTIENALNGQRHVIGTP